MVYAQLPTITTLATDLIDSSSSSSSSSSPLSLSTPHSWRGPQHYFSTMIMTNHLPPFSDSKTTGVLAHTELIQPPILWTSKPIFPSLAEERADQWSGGVHLASDEHNYNYHHINQHRCKANVLAYVIWSERTTSSKRHINLTAAN